MMMMMMSHLSSNRRWNLLPSILSLLLLLCTTIFLSTATLPTPTSAQSTSNGTDSSNSTDTNTTTSPTTTSSTVYFSLSYSIDTLPFTFSSSVQSDIATALACNISRVKIISIQAGSVNVGVQFLADSVSPTTSPTATALANSLLAQVADLSSALYLQSVTKLTIQNSGTSTNPSLTSSSSTSTKSTYPIDWSLVPTTQPALSIPDNTELGTCICDLTVGKCDVNCGCDTDCTAAEILHFSSSLDYGPRVQSVPTCLDPDLVSINKRGALTVELVNNMLCVKENNNPSLGSYFNPPTSLTDPQFSSARTAYKYLYEIQDPIKYEDSSSSTSTSTDTSYQIDSLIRIARQDLSIASPQTFYVSDNSFWSVPYPNTFTGECTDSVNYIRYGRTTSTQCRRTVADLQTTCTSGGIFSAARYTQNIYVGIIRTASPSLVTQYVALNISTLSHLSTATGVITDAGVAQPITSTNFLEPTWNTVTCACDNVLSSLTYTISNEVDGKISTTTAPQVSAVLQSLKGSDTTVCGGAAYVVQTYQTVAQSIANSTTTTTTATTPIRSRSGNPGYLTGFPVLSGTLQTLVISTPNAQNPVVNDTSTKLSVAQDVNGMKLLPIGDDGSCTKISSSVGVTSTLQSVTFGQDAKYTCYLSLDLSSLKSLCDATSVTNVLPYFGSNLSTAFGVWGASDFRNVNEWIVADLPQAQVGLWNSDTRTCSGLTTSLNLEFAVLDAGSIRNPQTRIISAKYTYSTSTWRFTKDSALSVQRFPVSATVTFIRIPATGVHEYVPTAPPLLPKFPSDLLYPLYIESGASRSYGATVWLVVAFFAVLLQRHI